MRQILMIIIALACTLGAGAQTAKELYQQGKALYDAKDYAKAFPILQKAAQKGNKKAQYRLGRCYAKGKGVDKDKNEAFRWYSKSADQDYGKAQYQLGKCYLKGKGVQADEKKARKWLNKAIKNPKHGTEILQSIRDEAAKGDEDAKAILQLLNL